jgi:hypothetical protein
VADENLISDSTPKSKPIHVAVADENLISDSTPKSKVQTDTIILRSVCTRLLSEGITDIKKVAEEVGVVVEYLSECYLRHETQHYKTLNQVPHISLS